MAAAEAINAITFNDAFTVIAGIAARLIEIAAVFFIVFGAGKAVDRSLPSWFTAQLLRNGKGRARFLLGGWARARSEGCKIFASLPIIFITRR